jgi:hypothetical protein
LTKRSAPGTRWHFLPLFYIGEYRDIASSRLPVQYDLSFVGTVHSDDYRFIKQIHSLASEKSHELFLHVPDELCGVLQTEIFRPGNFPAHREVNFGLSPCPNLLPLM